MSCNVISIGPVSDNPETEMRLAFGDNVSALRVIGWVQSGVDIKERYGLITNQEAVEMIKETEDKLKSLNKLA
jgi:hypothetical protein